MQFPAPCVGAPCERSPCRARSGRGIGRARIQDRGGSCRGSPARFTASVLSVGHFRARKYRSLAIIRFSGGRASKVSRLIRSLITLIIWIEPSDDLPILASRFQCAFLTLFCSLFNSAKADEFCRRFLRLRFDAAPARMVAHSPRAFPWEIEPPVGARQGTGNHQRQSKNNAPLLALADLFPRNGCSANTRLVVTTNATLSAPRIVAAS